MPVCYLFCAVTWFTTNIRSSPWAGPIIFTDLHHKNTTIRLDIFFWYCTFLVWPEQTFNAYKYRWTQQHSISSLHNIDELPFKSIAILTGHKRFINKLFPLTKENTWASLVLAGAAVAEWLSSWLTEQEDRGSIPGLATWIFRDWSSPASKSRYGWKIAKSTLILKQPTNLSIGYQSIWICILVS